MHIQRVLRSPHANHIPNVKAGACLLWAMKRKKERKVVRKKSRYEGCSAGTVGEAEGADQW